MQQYDYIIAGGGAAGLSLVHRLLHSSLRDKKILIVDQAVKAENDRTWSFWEEGDGPFEAIVCKKWPILWIYQGEDFGKRLPISPYTYKMILGADFYQHIDKLLAQNANVKRLYGSVSDIQNNGQGVKVWVGQEVFKADYCFSSIPQGPIDKTKVNYLDQHFRGWFIRTEQDVFAPNEAIMMDFRTPQFGETRFLYVLPSNEREALVEVAIFSNNHLKQEAYDDILANYLKQYWPQIKGFTIERVEQGNIPMTDHQFQSIDGQIIYLGMAGGDTRASSGYTFYNIQRRVDALVRNLEAGKRIAAHTGTISARHEWYDSVFLQVLATNAYPGDYLFRRLFANSPVKILLRFLNAESSIQEDIRVMMSAPIRVFTWVAIRRFFSRLFK